jgi:hypothetical protein
MTNNVTPILCAHNIAVRASPSSGDFCEDFIPSQYFVHIERIKNGRQREENEKKKPTLWDVMCDTDHEKWVNRTQ